MSSGVIIGADIGGTFTDVVLLDRRDGRSIDVKVLTTPHDPAAAVLTALREGLEQLGATAGDVERVVHATTLPTNLVLERKGARVGFVTTHGFGDMFELSRQHPSGPDRFNLRWERPPTLVTRACTVEVIERTGPRGEVWRPLDVDDTRGRLDALGEHEPESFAICLLHAYANDAHERRVAELVEERFPGTPVLLSSEVWPELREYERAAATVVSAYVGPVLASYAGRLDAELRALGVRAPLHIMQSSGAVMRVDEAVRRGVYTIESGPAAGVMAAAHTGRTIGCPDLLSFDMGGTTAKAGLVLDGRPRIAPEFRVGGRASASGAREAGEPIRIPVVDLAEVGAGGGSIAWVDAGGHLRLGPQSAGADPGPACYGRGGALPTVTDANLVLGYLDATSFNGGRMPLHADRARDAIEEHLAAPLGMSIVDAARGVHALANTSMGAAIRIVTLQRGIDPRDHAIVAFGGAGPVHIVNLARMFGIREVVVVPVLLGVKSAHGLLISDLAHETIRTLMVPMDEADPAALEEELTALEARARDALGADAAPGSAAVVVRSLDLGFAHKFLSTPVALEPGAVTHASLATAEARFREEQRRTFGVETRDRCRVMGARVRVVVPVGTASVHAGPAAIDAWPAPSSRPVWFDDAGAFVDTPVMARRSLAPGRRVEGPVVVEEPDSTTVCPPTHVLVVDDHHNLVIRAKTGLAAAGSRID